MFTSVQLPPAVVWNEFAACVFDLLHFFDLSRLLARCNAPLSEGGKSSLMHLFRNEHNIIWDTNVVETGAVTRVEAEAEYGGRNVFQQWDGSRFPSL